MPRDRGRWRGAARNSVWTWKSRGSGLVGSGVFYELPHQVSRRTSPIPPYQSQLGPSACWVDSDIKIRIGSPAVCDPSGDANSSDLDTKPAGALACQVKKARERYAKRARDGRRRRRRTGWELLDSCVGDLQPHKARAGRPAWQACRRGLVVAAHDGSAAMRRPVPRPGDEQFLLVWRKRLDLLADRAAGIPVNRMRRSGRCRVSLKKRLTQRRPGPYG